MSDHRRAEDLAELATGAVVGLERARVLQHVVACGSCMRELAELSLTADDLLSLAPRREPPAGFESMVIAHMAVTDRPPPRRRHKILVALIAAVIAAALGATAVWLSTAGDRRAAQEMRTAGGSHFAAVPIRRADGTRAGAVFLYDGNPSWLMVSVDGAPVDGAYAMIVRDRNGATYAGEVCEVEQGVGMDGYRLWRPAEAIVSVEMVGPDGIRLTADLTEVSGR